MQSNNNTHFITRNGTCQHCISAERHEMMQTASTIIKVVIGFSILTVFVILALNAEQVANIIFTEGILY